MADTFTSNLNLTKPAVGSSSNTWGGKLNANLDAVDAKFAGTTGSVVLRNTNSQSIIAGVRPDDASGTDQAGTAVNITSGCGTGTGAGGQINLQTAPASASSGSAANAPVTQMSIASDGDVTIANDLAVTGALSCASITVNGVAGIFPSGTRMLFQQDSAPTGWTKQTDNDDKALRVVSGSVSTGGSVAFSTAFASHTPAGSVATSVSGTVAGRSLTQAQIPSHRHFVSANITGNSLGNLTASNSMRRGGHQELASNNSEDYHLGGAGTTDATVGRTSATGSGQSHDHGWSGSASSTFSGTAIDLSVSYVDVIVAQKD